MKKGQVFFRLAPYSIFEYDFSSRSAYEDERHGVKFL